MRVRAALLALAVFALLAAGVWGWRKVADRRVDGLPWRVGLWRGELLNDLARQELRRVELEVRVETTGELNGVARLQFGVASSPYELRLLLNPALRIASLTVNGSATGYRREAEFLTVALASPGETLDLAVEYTGVLQEARLEQELLYLPPDTFWYPVVPGQFAPFAIQVNAPEALTVVLPGRLRAEKLMESRQLQSWTSEGPTAGVTFALGRLQHRELPYGNIRCEVYASKLLPNAPVLLSAAGRLASYYQNLLGAGAGTPVRLLMLDAVPPLLPGGVVVLRPEVGELDPLPALALPLAVHHWNAVVGGTWLGDEMSGGAWVATAIPQYLAWLGVDYFLGQQAVQEAVASLALPSHAAPVRTLDLWDFGRLPVKDREELTALMGYEARVFAQAAGRDEFLQACRRLIEHHQHRSVGVQAFQTELEVAAEMDVAELFRQWLDLPVHFDYGIAEVAQVEGGIRVRLRNYGEPPAPFPLNVRVETDGEAREVEVSVGMEEGEVTLRGLERVRRVELDPEHLLPDVERKNNLLVVP